MHRPVGSRWIGHSRQLLHPPHSQNPNWEWSPIETRLQRSEQFRVQWEQVDLKNRVLALPMPEGRKSRLRHGTASLLTLVALGSLQHQGDLKPHRHGNDATLPLISRRAFCESSANRGHSIALEKKKMGTGGNTARTPSTAGFCRTYRTYGAPGWNRTNDPQLRRPTTSQ